MASVFALSLPKPAIARASLAAIGTTSAESLEEKFGRKGIKFLDLNNAPAVELKVRNGSSLRLQIPDAHVTSYQPRVSWKDDGFYELLYTMPPRGESDSKSSRGGIALAINDASRSDQGAGSLVNCSEWSVKDVDSDAIDALQVELSSTNGSLELRYVVSLYPLSMATAVIVKNNGSKAVTLTSAILSHLKLKNRGRSGIQGLRGCSYISSPPLASPFGILSPAEAMASESPGWLDFGAEPEDKAGTWGEQRVPITILKRKMSRVYGAPPQERLKPIYNTTPSKYEVLDQGVELFFRVIRMGFEDIYVCSPGAMSDKYGADYFICTGPASLLVPITLNPQEEWRGAQVIQHDNL